MANDVYTADMGNPPVEQDAAILANRKRGMPPAGMAPARTAMPPVGRPNPADAGIYTADKGMPPSPDDMGSIAKTAGKVRPKTERQMKAAKSIKAAMGMKKGGSVGSASKRADGIATKGKTKGRIV